MTGGQFGNPVPGVEKNFRWQGLEILIGKKSSNPVKMNLKKLKPVNVMIPAVIAFIFCFHSFFLFFSIRLSILFSRLIFSLFSFSFVLFTLIFKKNLSNSSISLLFMLYHFLFCVHCWQKIDWFFSASNSTAPKDILSELNKKFTMRTLGSNQTWIQQRFQKLFILEVVPQFANLGKKIQFSISIFRTVVISKKI